MKKILSILLTLVLILSTAACSKKVNADDESQHQNPSEIQEPVDGHEPEEYYYVLYLKHKDGPFIFPDTFTVKENDYRLIGRSIEEFVMDELINQKGSGELINPIPRGTKVLSVQKEENTVIVDLSKEFSEGMRGSKEEVEATIAVIVNTLTTLPGNDFVKILVEGQTINNLKGVDISAPLEFISEFYIDK